MSETNEFSPSKLKALGLTNHAALGRAMHIMLKAVGFGTVEIVKPVDACKRAKTLKPDFILFTPEYLTCSINEKKDIGCPCKEKKGCDNALVVVLLKKHTVDNVLMSKDMGFDGIIFADATVDKIHESLEKVYLHYHTL